MIPSGSSCPVALAYMASSQLYGTQGVILCLYMQELFETPYFCQDQKQDFFENARPFEGNPVLEQFSKLAAELSVVLPISYFERANNAFYNSLAVYDADGSCAGRYRKSHIPDGTG